LDKNKKIITKILPTKNQKTKKISNISKNSKNSKKKKIQTDFLLLFLKM
jgi:hypothetical protein